MQDLELLGKSLELLFETESNNRPTMEEVQNEYPNTYKLLLHEDLLDVISDGVLDLEDIFLMDFMFLDDPDLYEEIGEEIEPILKELLIKAAEEMIRGDFYEIEF